MKKKTIIVLIVVIALGIGGVWIFRAQNANLDERCIQNLRQIDSGKQQWALEKFSPFDKDQGKWVTDWHAYSNATPTVEELIPYLCRQHSMPQCPRGGRYTIRRVADFPTCSYPGHALK
jgi:hypothetical protein